MNEARDYFSDHPFGLQSLEAGSEARALRVQACDFTTGPSSNRGSGERFGRSTRITAVAARPAASESFTLGVPGDFSGITAKES